MFEKIVKPKETVVESKLKKQVRGSIKQGDLLPQPCGGRLPRRKLRPYAGLRLAAPCSWHPAGEQKVHEHEAPGGCP